MAKLLAVLITLPGQVSQEPVFPGPTGQPDPSATENFPLKKLYFKNNIILIQEICAL